MIRLILVDTLVNYAEVFKMTENPQEQLVAPFWFN